MIEPAEKVRKLTPYQHCFNHWAALHRKILGVPYLKNHPKDAKDLTPVIEAYGVEGTKELIGYFWAEQKNEEAVPDSSARWIGKANPVPWAFVAKIPSILKAYTLENKPDA